MKTSNNNNNKEKQYTSIGGSKGVVSGDQSPSLFIAQTEAENRTEKNLLICLGSGRADPYSDLNI